MCVILFLAIAVFAVLFISITNDKAYEKYMSAAELSIENEDYESALSALRKASNIDASEKCLTQMADCYEILGNYDKALEALRQLDTSNPVISARIAADEARKANGAQAGSVTIAGESYYTTDTSLVLDSKNLDNSVISQIIQLYALDNLSLADNNISDIYGLTSLGGLTTLNLKNNNISDITPLASLTSLRTLYLDGNPIRDFSPLYNLPNLTFLSIKGVELKDSELKALSSALPNCAINGADASEEAELVALGGVTFSIDIKDPLDLSNRGITDISVLSKCSNLTSVNLSGNDITDITPLMDIQYLSHVDLSNNSVTDLRPLMGLTSLKYLNVANNGVTTTVPLGANTSLNELYLDNNPINNFTGLRKLKNLISLSLTNTGIGPGDLENFKLLSKLLTLNISDNPNMTGEAYEQLRDIIPKCEITHSDLVYTFTFDGNNIASDTTMLDLPGRGISDLSPLMKLGSLQYVNLSNNNISDLYYFGVSQCRTSITELNLADNNIVVLDGLANMTGLQVLNLSNNDIYSVTPLYGLENLRELYISGNQLNESQIIELNKYLPNCTIFSG